VLSNNLNDATFEACAAEVYSNLKPSAKDLVQTVHKYMADVLWKLTESTFAAFPRLQTAIKALVRPAEGTYIYTHCHKLHHAPCMSDCITLGMMPVALNHQMILDSSLSFKCNFACSCVPTPALLQSSYN